MSREEWKQRTEGIRQILLPKTEVRGLVSFLGTNDGLARMQTSLKLKDTDAILLMIYGLQLKTGNAPKDVAELEKCLNYSGHPIRMERIQVNISHLRSANKIHKGELTLTTRTRDYVKAKYSIAALDT